MGQRVEVYRLNSSISPCKNIVVRKNKLGDNQLSDFRDNCEHSLRFYTLFELF